MNLVRAISLGGGGGDLRGNDSTGVICHVQLCLLAADWILNILADNFLRDPLGLLILFIFVVSINYPFSKSLQVFLLIIGLIFYLMSSANQAMKQGIHEKILRHHQVTIIMWTIYFSMLVWWYIWALKRSWPSAGEHFSFIFSAPTKSDLFSPPGTERTISDDDGSSFLTSTQRINDSVVETILGPTFRSVTTTPAGTAGLEETLSLTTPLADWSRPGSTPSMSTKNSSAIGAIISNTPQMLKEILKAKTRANPHNPFASALLVSPAFHQQQQKLANLNSSSTFGSSNNPGGVGNPSSDVEVIKFFWSPGFIAVYTIERSISLLFYVAYILGTLHIINAHMLEDEDKDDVFHNSANMSSSYSMNDLSSRRKSSSGFRNKNNNIGAKTSFIYDSATTHPYQMTSGREGYIESDSNIDMDDNFIRQLEDQDGDPFENEQYDYQYQIKKPGHTQSQSQRHGTARSYRDRRHPMPQLDSDETDEADDNISGHRGLDGKGKPKHLKSKRNKARKSSATKLEKTKGALRSMMMMSNLGHFPTNNNNTVIVSGTKANTKANTNTIANTNTNTNTITKGCGDNSNSITNLNADIYMTQSSITVGKSYSPENMNRHRCQNQNQNVTTAIVTASASIDTICTGSGSTDELLVAEVFTRSSNNNHNNSGRGRNRGNHRDELVGIDGFMDNNDNDYTDSDDSDDTNRARHKQGNKGFEFESPRMDSESALKANLSHFSPKDEKAFTKRKM